MNLTSLSNLMHGLVQDGAAAATEVTPRGFWMPEQASNLAPANDFVFMVITWISVFFFVLVVVLMTYFCIKYRQTPENRQASSSVTHNTPLELTWTIIPLLLVIVIFYVGMEGYINMRSAPIGTYDIEVTAQKWSWTFKHPNGAIQAEGELYVPANRPVRLLMQSQDVLHAVFIPDFRVKQDIVPGRMSYLWFTPLYKDLPNATAAERQAANEHDLYCAEYCGRDHSRMYAKVHVFEEEEFALKIAEAANWLKEYVEYEGPEEVMHFAGARLYRGRCSSCHTLDGTKNTGPSWVDVWERTSTGATVFTDGTTLQSLFDAGAYEDPQPENYIRESILNPRAHIVQDFTNGMAPFPTFTDDHIRAMIAFMQNLDKFDSKGVPTEIDPVTAQ